MPRLGRPYDTAEDAAAAALTESVRRSRESREGQEFLGGIFEQDGKFFFTEPAGVSERSRGRAKIRIPEGSLRGLFHNHPEGRGSDWFSPEDIEMASQLGVPSFVRMGADRDRVFDPGESETRSKAGQRGRFSRGDPFLAKLPTDQIRQRMMAEILGRERDDPRGMLRRPDGLLAPGKEQRPIKGLLAAD